MGAAVVLATSAAVTWWLSDRQEDARNQATPPPASACPMHQTNPPPAPARHAGDSESFITDITLPSCTHLPAGDATTKIWRFKNTGTLPWKGYTLRRLDLPQHRDQCQAIASVPIPDTPAGETADVTVEVTTPHGPTFCFVRFKMMDAEGNVAFPGGRLVNFQLIID